MPFRSTWLEATDSQEQRNEAGVIARSPAAERLIGYHYIPAPESETLKGIAVALFAIASFTDLLPTASGWNVTRIAQDLPEARFAGQSFDCGNREA